MAIAAVRSTYRFPVGLSFHSVGTQFVCHPADSALDRILISVDGATAQEELLSLSVTSGGVTVISGRDAILSTSSIRKETIASFDAVFQPLDGPVFATLADFTSGTLPSGMEVQVTFYFITQNVQ